MEAMGSGLEEGSFLMDVYGRSVGEVGGDGEGVTDGGRGGRG